MRSIEYLAQLFPDKTGRELFDIQAEDKRNDELQFKVENERSLAIVEDIKLNGGYFRGAFGTDQYYMSKVKKIEFDGNHIYCEVEHMTLFDSQNLKTSVLRGGSIHFEIQTDKYIKFDDLTFNTVRIKAEEYNQLRTLLFGVVPKFFKEEWEERQKEFGIK